MKKTLCLLLLVSMSIPGIGHAQTESASTPIKFIDMKDFLIEGEYVRPQVLYTNAREKVKFERLLKLKRSFLPKLHATANDASLR